MHVCMLVRLLYCQSQTTFGCISEKSSGGGACLVLRKTLLTSDGIALILLTYLLCVYL